MTPRMDRLERPSHLSRGMLAGVLGLLLALLPAVASHELEKPAPAALRKAGAAGGFAGQRPRGLLDAKRAGSAARKERAASASRKSPEKAAGAGGGACPEGCLAGAIACGETRSGNLPAAPLPACRSETGGALVLWSFELPEQLQVTVSLTSAEFDSYLFLFDASCRRIASNDDCPGRGLNSCLEFNLDPGAYLLGVSSYESGESGAYTLSLACSSFNFCRECPPLTIECNSSRSGALSFQDCRLPLDSSFIDLYRFELERPGPVTIRQRSASFDSFLFLFDSRCNVIARNDDCPGGGLNSCITRRLEAGTYHIGANSLEPGETGPYTIELACADTRFCNDCEAGRIACGERREGTLPASGCKLEGGAAAALWRLDVEATINLRASLRSQAFEPALRLFDEACQPIALGDTESCDPSEPGAACLFLTLAPGVYHLGASSRDPGQSGDYALEIECSDFDPCSDCRVGDIACGESVAGELAAGDCSLDDGSFFEVWSLRLEAPQEVDIRLSSSAFDTFLFLADAGCSVIDFNDDAEGTNSRLVVNLPPGEYSIVANSFSKRETGGYSLEVRCGEITFCRDCRIGAVLCNEPLDGRFPQSRCQLDGIAIDLYTFQLPRAGTVDLRLRAAGFDPFLLFFDSSCIVTAFNDDCTEGDFTLSCLTLELEAGEYHAGVSSYSAGESGEFTLEVACQGVVLCDDCLAGAIACGETAGGSLSASACRRASGSAVEYWRLELAEESSVTIRMASSDIDPYLIVQDASCREVAANDDCDATTLDACLQLTLGSGVWFIGASSAFPGEVGPYSLTVDGCGRLGGGRQVPGDCNQDGRTDLEDAVCIVGVLFLGKPALFPCGDGRPRHEANIALIDWQADGRVDISDAVALLTALFSSGPGHSLAPAGGQACVPIAGCPDQAGCRR
jgi:hypothetical protein